MDNQEQFLNISKDFRVWTSDVIEFLFCPRFIFYDRVLKIEQNEELRQKVLIGRKIHENKIETLKDYHRKRLGVEKKDTEVHISSEVLHITGIVDEVLFIDDGTISPLDYKFAEYPGFVYKGLFYQSMIYSLLIEELYKKKSNYGFIVFTRSANHLEKITYPSNKLDLIKSVVQDIYEIIINCQYPDVKESIKKCNDCCYRRLCYAD